MSRIENFLQIESGLMGSRELEEDAWRLIAYGISFFFLRDDNIKELDHGDIALFYKYSKNYILWEWVSWYVN